MATRISHFCSVCGNEIDDTCVNHPSAAIDAVRLLECESCLENGTHTPATTHSKNPDYIGYDLCGSCAAEYDSRARTATHS